MSYTIEFRGRKIINKRSKKDLLRYNCPSLPPLQFNLTRAIDERGNVYRRTLNTKPSASFTPTIEHLKRKADGGTNNLTNLALAHKICNNTRHSFKNESL